MKTLRKHWLVAVIILAGVLLTALGGMQFVWTGQLSEAQRAMMEVALSNSMRQFDQELERESLFLISLMQPEIPGSGGLEWQRWAERHAFWSGTSSYPGLVSRMLAYLPQDDGEWSLLELPEGEQEPVEAAWAGKIRPLQGELAAFQDNRRLRQELRPGMWVVFPQASALVRPIGDLDRFRRGPDRFGRASRRGFVILILDWDYLLETILPSMVDRWFSGPDQSRLYELAVATADGEHILYRSDDSIDGAWLEQADLIHRPRLMRAGASPPPARPGQGPGFGSPRRGAQGPRAGWRPRMLVAGMDPATGLEYAASHVTGSLEGVVAGQRARNLGAGFGVLLLLAGATALVIVSARRASRLAGMQMEFIAGVTHELRTPLSVICSVGENLADGVVKTADGAKRYGELIRSQGRRLSEMVEDTLQFAALESGKRQYVLSQVDPGEALKRAIEQARPMIERAGFALETGESGDLPPVKADDAALQQILANLLSNAVKYGEPGRWVRVEAVAEPPEVRIRVRDKGPGIPKHEEARVFDAFYRGSAAGEGSIEGSGLGLKLASDLATGMGARLSLHSEPGKGTAFTVHLPVPRESGA